MYNCKLFPIIALISVLLPIEVNAEDNNYTNALIMREWCQGVENSQHIANSNILINVQKYPNADKCLGAFLVLQPELMSIDDQTHQRAFFPYSCPGAGIDLVQLVKVFTHYVDQHPEIANEWFLGIAMQSFNQAWPCKNESVR